MAFARMAVWIGASWPRRFTSTWAQAVAITGDPDSPVIFHLAMGDGLVPKVIDGEIVPEKALGAPLVAIATQDDED